MKHRVPFSLKNYLRSCSSRGSRLWRLGIPALALWMMGIVVVAADATSGTAVPPVTIIGVTTSLPGGASRFGLGDQITVKVDGSEAALKPVTNDLRKVVLLLNHVALRGLCTNAIAGQGILQLQFLLERTEVNKPSWIHLQGSPRSLTRAMDLEIALETGGALSVISDKPASAELVLLPNEPFIQAGSERWMWAFCGTAIAGAALLLVLASSRSLNSLVKGPAWVAWLIALVGVFLCWGPTACWVMLTFIFVAGFFHLALNTEMLRDSGPPPPEGKLRPYSLARSQMAAWFFLGISAFVFIWLMTGALDTITGTVLTLMGIGAGTALGAEAQEAGKLSKLSAEKAVLEAKPQRTPEEEGRLFRIEVLTADVPGLERKKRQLKQEEAVKLERVAELNQMPARGAPQEDEKTMLGQALASIPSRIARIDEILAARPVSQGFLDDVLTDDVGISFHRFQMFVWTIVLGFVFVSSVYRRLAMPEFNATLLALMGLSSATYMGFMIAERPAAPPR